MEASVELTALFLLPLLLSAEAFLHGFPKDRCDDMDPTLITIDKSSIKEEAEFNSSTDYGFEEPPPTSVQPSTRLNLFRIVTSSPKYRRGRVLDITIRGPEFNAFMLQVRKIGSDERRGFDKVERVGEFTSWPSTLQPVMCDSGKAVTALTNKNFNPKSDVTVKWKAPNNNVGDIHVVGRFISGDEYWQISESREIPLNEFPVNLAKCGKARACVMYSETLHSCHEDNCDYILTYIVANNSFVEFALGGNVKGENSFLAVGFSNEKEATNMKMVACSRAKTVAEIKYFFIANPEEGLMEHPAQPLENRKMDLDGDRMWCSFTVPMTAPSGDENELDLTKPLFQVYMRGRTNYTKTTNLPIIPSKPLISEKKIHIQEIKSSHHKMKKQNGKGAFFCANLVLLITGLFMVYNF